jgi:anti-sigma-K factor RskA
VDIKAYIESGILESYVMGLASAEEALEVEKNIAAYPELKKEMEAIEDALAGYAMQHEKTPPAHVKQELMSKLFSESKPEAKVINISSAKQINETRSSGFRLWAAASVALLLLSVAGNYFLYDKLKHAENEIVALNNEKAVLASQMDVQKTSFEQMGKEMAILKQPFNKIVLMKGVPATSPNSMATVYWNQNTKEVFINVNSLPSPPPGKQYQLWALKDGQAIDAGVFDVSDSAKMQKMKIIESAQGFAVTLEKMGGVPKAEGAMYVIGNI